MRTAPTFRNVPLILRAFGFVLAGIAVVLCSIGARAADTAPAETVGAELHELTDGHAEFATGMAQFLRMCLPAPAVYAWLHLNANALETMHDERSARRLWRAAATLAHVHQWPFPELEAWNAGAKLSLDYGDFDDTLGSARNARALAQRLHDAYGEATADFFMSSALRLRGEVNEAQKLAAAAEKLAQRAGDSDAHARALNELATLTKNKGDYLEGLEYAIQATHDEPPGSDPRARAITLSKLSKLYEQIEDDAQALAYADRALQAAENQPDRKALMYVLVGYANTLNDLRPELHARALDYAQRAFAFSREVGNRTMEVDAELQIARAQFNGADYAAAGTAFDHALATAHAIGLKQSIAHIQLRRGELYERNGRLADAIAIYQGADNLPRLIKSYAILDRQLSAAHDPAGARDARLERFELRDRILGASAMRGVVQLDARRLQDAQQQQIELLKRQGEIDTLRLERSHLLRWIILLFAVSLALALGLTILRIRRSERVNRLLSHAVNTDALTGADSRRHGLQTLREDLARADEGGDYAVLLIDVDNFKQINDRHGHLLGDRVLAEIASCLRSGLRPGDSLVRFGGEEFLVLLPHTSLAAAADLAESLRRHAEHHAHALEAQRTVTISIGVCVRSQMPGADAKALLDMADRALYAAKHAGRNRTCVYADAPADAAMAIDPS
jgi:diguanylate cyclase (GGDEF)-like protein